MAEVVDIDTRLLQIGAGRKIDPDMVLEEAKGEGFERLLLIGEREDGSIYVAGNVNAGEILFLMERSKRVIVFGEEA